jgi:hypothetical protein
LGQVTSQDLGQELLKTWDKNLFRAVSYPGTALNKQTRLGTRTSQDLGQVTTQDFGQELLKTWDKNFSRLGTITSQDLGRVTSQDLGLVTSHDLGQVLLKTREL